VYIPFRPLRYLWQLMAVTISAQVLTMPIILYHFHQFPNLFLITNLLIVPLSGLVLYGCIVLLAVSPLHAVALIAGNIIEKTLRVMNQIILFFDQLNFSVTNHIELHFIQVALYYVMVIAIGCRIIYKKPLYATIGVVSGLVIVGFHSNRQITIRNTGRLVIYQTHGQTMTDIGSGGTYYSWTSDQPDKTAEKFLASSRTQLGFVQSLGRLSTKEYPVVQINHRTLVFTDKAPKHGFFPADIVVVQKGAFLNMSDLHRVFNARQYIFDGNNALWKIRKWKKEADSLHLRHHSVPEQGAFVMEY